MASRVLLALLPISLALVLLNTNISVAADDAVTQSDGPDSSLKMELDKLNSHILTLESSAADKALQLKNKDDLISEKEKVISEMADKTASLEAKIVSLKKKGPSNADEQIGKPSELEKLVDSLRKELEAKDNELHSKIANLVNIIKEKETRIHKTERALQVVEEELMKAKLEAISKVHELTKIHGAWLPPWLAAYLIRCQSHLETNWNMHGKPALEKVIQKALEKKSEAEKWAEPHVETIKIKYIPAVKEQWVTITTTVDPHIQSVTEKAVGAYISSKTTLTPHVIKVQEVVDPYVKEIRKISKPHVDKIQVALSPYTATAVEAYGNFLESATVYHQQVQVTVQEKLEEYELTKAFATKEFVWFAASALLALPIIILFRVCSATFCKKEKKPIRNGNLHHPRRKTKRPHSEK